MHAHTHIKIHNYIVIMAFCRLLTCVEDNIYEDIVSVTASIQLQLPEPSCSAQMKAESLLTTVHMGDLQCVQSLIYNGVSPNVMLEGCTPLIEAVQYGCHDMMQFLLHEGAIVNLASEHFHYTPLHKAAFQGDIRAAEILLEFGADCSRWDRSGNTLLIIAIMRGNCKLVRLLITKGADVNAKNKHDERPLQKSIVQGCAEITELLLKAGADVNVFDSMFNTPLHQATNRGHVKMMQVLLKHRADVDKRAILGRTALDMAISRGHEEALEVLLKYGANPNGTSPRSYPLFKAVSRLNIRVIKCLLKHGANPDPSCYPLRPKNILAKYLSMWRTGHYDINIAKILVDSVSRLCTDEPLTSPIHLVATLKETHTSFVTLKYMLGVNYEVLNKESLDRYPINDALTKSCYKHVQVLYLAGANNASLFRLYNAMKAKENNNVQDEAIPMFHDQAIPFFLNLLKSPRSLQDLCGISLRHVLACGLSDKVHHLPLPDLLKENISLDTLDVLEGEYSKI